MMHNYLRRITIISLFLDVLMADPGNKQELEGELTLDFSEKKAMALLYKLEQHTVAKDKFSTSSLDLGIRQHMRTQTVWFFFLIVTGFSLAIELTFELFQMCIRDSLKSTH